MQRPNDSTPQQPSERQGRRLNEAWITRLQERFLTMYGHRFQSLFPDEQSLEIWRDTWAQGLADLSSQQLGHGLACALKDSMLWPPSLPEFRAMCETLRNPSKTAPHPALLAPMNRSEHAKAELGKVLEMLRSKQKEQAA